MGRGGERGGGRISSFRFLVQEDYLTTDVQRETA